MSRRYPPLSEINITNLVDVTMVLLIIFMITAPLMRSGIQVELPKTQVSDISSQVGLVITLTRRAEIYVDEQLVTIETFGTALSKAMADHPGQQVLLKADREVPYGQVIRIMDQIKLAGISNLGLIIIPEKRL